MRTLESRKGLHTALVGLLSAVALVALVALSGPTAQADSGWSRLQSKGYTKTNNMEIVQTIDACKKVAGGTRNTTVYTVTAKVKINSIKRAAGKTTPKFARAHMYGGGSYTVGTSYGKKSSIKTPTVYKVSGTGLYKKDDKGLVNLSLYDTATGKSAAGGTNPGAFTVGKLKTCSS